MPTTAANKSEPRMAAIERVKGHRQLEGNALMASVTATLGGHSQSHADRPAQGRKHDRLDEKLPQDVARRAPTARRMPISRVRSVTETSMMFMMPTPPTTSDTLATAPRSSVRVMEIISSTRKTSAMLWIVKSSSLPARM